MDKRINELRDGVNKIKKDLNQIEKCAESIINCVKNNEFILDEKANNQYVLLILM